MAKPPMSFVLTFVLPKSDKEEENRVRENNKNHHTTNIHVQLC